MSDLKGKLRQLDRLDTPDVWKRANTLEPPRATDPDLAQHPARRVVAGVLALAVFVAAGAFAQRAFRSTQQGPIGLVPSSIDGYMLWPERTGSALADTQALVDAGDPTVAWRLDPKEVATRFAERVLAWGEPDGRYSVSVELPPTDRPVTSLSVTLSRYAIPCPSPLPGSESYCPPPFQGERLQLQQMGTVGDRGIWSVTEVRAPDVSLVVGAGDAVADGSSISGGIAFPSQFSLADANPRVIGHAGITIGTGDGCFIEGITDDADERFSVDASIPSASRDSCGISPAGYVWAAVEPYPEVLGYGPNPDPLYASTKDVYPGDTPFTVYALTAVPMTVSNYPGETVSPVPTNAGTDTTSADPAIGEASTSAVLQGSAIRCTATFASDVVKPGEETNVHMRETNISDAPVKVEVDFYSAFLLIQSGGQQVADTSQQFVGMHGGVGVRKTLAPGETTDIHVADLPVIWAGPLQVTPICQGQALPPVMLQVAATMPPVNADAALSSAVQDTGKTFDDCVPTVGAWTTGTVPDERGGYGPFDARCGAWVEERGGFDLVVLGIVSPPDAPEIDLTTLPNNIEAMTTLDVPPGTNIAVSWFVYVVTSDEATLTAQRGLALCRSSETYGELVVGSHCDGFQGAKSARRNAELTPG